ncbi:hypothetical protein [Pseudidiomarina aestuarii]|uniref:hypothetical protein n=1 Tax=Pseudidiomarina aestuarii TaxID=624146 RepID=UPI003A981B0B
MNKVTNKKECYQSRSKRVSEFSNIHPATRDEKISREQYKVDCSGYFIWGSRGDPQKI